MAVERLLLRLRRFARPLSRLLLRERQLLRQRLMPNPPLPEVLLQLRELLCPGIKAGVHKILRNQLTSSQLPIRKGVELSKGVFQTPN